MNHVLVVFGSVTVANRAKRLMEKRAGYAAVVQLPPDLGIRGCSYCLRIRQGDYNRMLELAEEFGLKIKAMFLEKEINGQKVYETI